MAEVVIEAEPSPDTMGAAYVQACAWVRAVLNAPSIDARLWALSRLLRTLGVDPTGPLALRPAREL